MSYYQHESAYVDDGAVVGEGTKIWHFCHVAAGARIGSGCALGQNVYVAPTVIIGDGVRIQNNVSLYDGVIVEDHAFIGPSAVFTNVVNPRSEVARKHEYRRTVVGRGASIGANATVVCGHDLGAYAFLGAGAVLTRSLPDFAMAIGVPARAVGWMCRCGEQLRLEGGAARCGACGRAYHLEGHLESATLCEG